MSEQAASPVLRVGRYALYDEIARGGMATVHIGRLLGAAGFARVVAVKRLHPHLAKDATFVAMLLDEARLAGRIQHPNVAATLDVIATDEELFVVMEYLPGETLSRLLKSVYQAGLKVPPDIASAIGVGLLRGLHAAHEARGERGEPLELVHRDVSPQNVMVRSDGQVLVLDFGVAKAEGRFQVTEEGNVKGKLPYMAPEQVRGLPLTRKVDIYAAGAVLWETLTAKRLFAGNNEGEVLHKLLFGEIPLVKETIADIPPAVDDVIAKALKRPVEERFASAAEMADALEEAQAPASPGKVARWLEGLRGKELSAQAGRVMAISSSVLDTGELETPALPSLLRDKIKPPGGKEGGDELIAEGPPDDPPAGSPDPDAAPPAEAPAVVVAPPSSPPAAAAVGEATLVGSLASSVPPPASAKRSPLPLVLGAFVAVGLVLALVLMIVKKDDKTDEPARNLSTGSAAGSVVSAAATAAPLPPSAASTVIPAPAAASVITSAAPPVGSTPVVVGATPPGLPKPAAKKACSPVTIDAAGRKHFNPACIQ